MKPNIVSLFSGVGGIDAGFKKAGFKTIVATDISELFCKSFKKNFKESKIINADVRKVNFKYIKKKFPRIDGIVGGPPCPPFSKSRFYIKEKKRAMKDIDGKETIENFFRTVKELDPKFFFFENVHGFIYKPHIESLNYLKTISKKLGFKIFYKVINSADYGVPQTRERFICIGVKIKFKNFEFPEITHSKNSSDNNLKKWVTAGDVLNNIDFDLPEDKKMVAGSKHKNILKKIPPGDNYLYFTKKRNHPKPLFKWRSRYWSFLLKLSPKRPSWTIQASHSNNMGPFHWKNRFLRILEIKRLQTFADKHVILGNYKDQWRQIGNAVPPLLAYKIADKIKKLYF
jgi:DNA (cytosine-5)-methyltransferase 1